MGERKINKIVSEDTRTYLREEELNHKVKVVDETSGYKYRGSIITRERPTTLYGEREINGKKYDIHTIQQPFRLFCLRLYRYTHDDKPTGEMKEIIISTIKSDVERAWETLSSNRVAFCHVEDVIEDGRLVNYAAIDESMDRLYWWLFKRITQIDSKTYLLIRRSLEYTYKFHDELEIV